MKFKEAELTINKILLDTLDDVSQSEVFFADMSERDKEKVTRAINKAKARIHKLQVTLVKQLMTPKGFEEAITGDQA